MRIHRTPLILSTLMAIITMGSIWEKMPVVLYLIGILILWTIKFTIKILMGMPTIRVILIIIIILRVILIFMMFPRIRMAIGSTGLNAIILTILILIRTRIPIPKYWIDTNLRLSH